MLRMENVSKTYRHRGHLVKALDGASFISPKAISSRLSDPAAAARARCC